LCPREDGRPRGPVKQQGREEKRREEKRREEKRRRKRKWAEWGLIAEREDKGEEESACSSIVSPQEQWVY
jgi:hypothetical protein